VTGPLKTVTDGALVSAGVMLPAPVLPEYQAACTSNIVPELIKQLIDQPVADWMPQELTDATQFVLLVVDGLGWDQLQERTALAPTLMTFQGGPITTVAPTTTATALTSIVTGRPPSVHGILGYRLHMPSNEVLNVLKWETAQGDAKERIPPEQFQTQPAFAGNKVPVVTRRHFAGSGFSNAHLQGVEVFGYSVPSSLPVEVWRLMKRGDPFVYAYYDGLDTVAHAHGFDEHYEAELYTVDRLIRDLVAGMPKGSALVVTSDHGQVEVGNRMLTIEPEIANLCSSFSGEGRFCWLHAKEGRVDELFSASREAYGELAWVHTRAQLDEADWFGGPLSPGMASRLGDVALVPSAPVAFQDPASDGESRMRCRHGSMTGAEVHVPLLVKKID